MNPARLMYVIIALHFSETSERFKNLPKNYFLALGSSISGMGDVLNPKRKIRRKRHRWREELDRSPNFNYLNELHSLLL